MTTEKLIADAREYRSYEEDAHRLLNALCDTIESQQRDIEALVNANEKAIALLHPYLDLGDSRFPADIFVQLASVLTTLPAPPRRLQ